MTRQVTMYDAHTSIVDIVGDNIHYIVILSQELNRVLCMDTLCIYS